MADFMAVTTCSHPRLKDHAEVEQILDRYFFDPDLSVGVSFDHDTGEPYLFLYGYAWPEAWRMPEGVTAETFDPYTDELYENGAPDFIQLLQEIAQHLAEPLTVQAVGSTKCRFPLSACEWHIEPGSSKVELNEFCHSDREEVVSAPEAA
jgi:hypothetical protein